MSGGPPTALCVVKGADVWWLWWVGMSDVKNTRNTPDAVIAHVAQIMCPRATDPEATEYGVWLGDCPIRGTTVEHRLQITIGRRKPKPTSVDDIIGKRIFTGRWAEAWETFEMHVRML